VAFGKHKSVSTFQLRIARVNPHVPAVEHYQRLDSRHAATDMSNPYPADRVHGHVADLPAFLPKYCFFFIRHVI
jgi:hypothetical protein